MTTLPNYTAGHWTASKRSEQAQASRDRFRRLLVEARVPGHVAAQYEAHTKEIMSIIAQVLKAQSDVISDLKAENATLKTTQADAADLAQVQTSEADPLVQAKLNPTPAPPAPNQSGGSAAAPNLSSGTTANGSAGSFVFTGGVLTDTAGRVVYTHAGTDPVDPTQWPAAGTYLPTTGSPESVYYFAGDATGPAGTATGVVTGVWATIPAPATA